MNNKNESEMESILDICAAVRQVKSHNRITRKHEPEGRIATIFNYR